jgi:hypothetical protein
MGIGPLFATAASHCSPPPAFMVALTRYDEIKDRFVKEATRVARSTIE